MTSLCAHQAVPGEEGALDIVSKALYCWSLWPGASGPHRISDITKSTFVPLSGFHSDRDTKLASSLNHLEERT